jgi:hypothetical protein
LDEASMILDNVQDLSSDINMDLWKGKNNGRKWF